MLVTKKVIWYIQSQPQSRTLLKAKSPPISRIIVEWKSIKMLASKATECKSATVECRDDEMI
jgi:hypothetical protein